MWDNEGAVGRGGKLTAEFAALAGLLGVRIFQTRPRDPEAKGLVERANGYLETSFLPGRTFSGPADCNAQLGSWLKVANRRRHRTIDARPADRWEADRAGMLCLPPVDPPAWWQLTMRLGRDHYVRVGTCDYSIHPRAIGHKVTVRVDTQTVSATCNGTQVAWHPRCWARHQTLTEAAPPAARRVPARQGRRPSAHGTGRSGGRATCAGQLRPHVHRHRRRRGERRGGGVLMPSTTAAKATGTTAGRRTGEQTAADLAFYSGP